MSTSPFGSKYWLDDYFGPYFQPEGEGGVIVGALAGSAAGAATVSATLSAASTGRSGAQRLAYARSYAWNADRISLMLGSVRQLLGCVEKEAKKPVEERAKVDVPPEIIEAVVTETKPAPKQTLDFIPTVRVSLADIDATDLVAELKTLEARLERLAKIKRPSPRLVPIVPPAGEDEAEEAVALALLDIPVERKPGKGVSVDDDELAALLLAA